MAPRPPAGRPREASASAPPTTAASAAAPTAPSPAGSIAPGTPQPELGEPVGACDVAVQAPNRPSASDDRIHAVAQEWPQVMSELDRRGATPLLWQGTPCAQIDEDTQPAIHDRTPASVSPDGRTLVIVATVEFDHAGAAALGVIDGGRQDEQTGTWSLALVIDGRTGALWSHPLQAFLIRNPNTHDLVWSADSRRVYFSTYTCHGSRVALVDITGRALQFEGFPGQDVVSPHCEVVPDEAVLGHGAQRTREPAGAPRPTRLPSAWHRAR